MLIAASPDIDGSIVGDVVGAGSTLSIVTANGSTRPGPRALAPTDVRHPVFQPFAGNAATLGYVTFQNLARVGGSACQTLARFTTGDTAFVECPSGDGRALVLASDLNNRWNDFPLHATLCRSCTGGALPASTHAHASVFRQQRRPACGAPGLATIEAAGVPRRIAVNVDPREADRHGFR